MARGFFSGLLWGGAASVVALGALSVVSDPPVVTTEPDSTSVRVPAGSEFNRNRPETSPLIPQSTEDDGPGETPVVLAPDEEPAPAADTAPAREPEPAQDVAATQPADADAPLPTAGQRDAAAANRTESGPALSAPAPRGDVPDTPETPEEMVTLEVSDLPGVDSMRTEVGADSIDAPIQPSDDQGSARAPVPTGPAPAEVVPSAQTIAPAPQATDSPAGLGSPDAGNVTIAALPQVTDTPQSTQAPRAVALPEPAGTVPAREPDPLPEPAPQATAPAEAAEPDQPEGDAEGEAAVIRLPRIGDESAEDDAPDETEEVVEETQDGLTALARNSLPFDATADPRPLIAIVLIDVGADGLDRETLKTFSNPVTIALDPTVDGAPDAASEYRAAGYEVLILSPPLASGTSGADVSSALSRYARLLPQAIGVVDSDTGGFQSNRRLVDQAVETLGRTGHGLVTYDRGLNTAQKMAEREGLPAATIFRMLDAERENTTTIKRYLERAALKAGQEGHVVMIGHSYPATVTAIFQWASEAGSQTVQFAPLSAILRR